MAQNTKQVTPERDNSRTGCQATAVSARFRRPAAVPLMFSEQAWAEVACSLRLSGREREIVRGVFSDDNEFAIAAALGISSHTVHTHFQRLYHKLGVTDRNALILRVVHEILTLTTLPESNLFPICANFAAGRCPLRD